MSAEKILQELKDELGHITLVADWAERKLKALLEKVCHEIAPTPVAAAEAVQTTQEPLTVAASNGDASIADEGDVLPEAQVEGNDFTASSAEDIAPAPTNADSEK